MKSKKLRELRTNLVAELALDRSASIQTVCQRLCEVLAHRLRREIRLRFHDLGPYGLSGAWAVTEHGVYEIIVTTTASWLQRLHILLHEVAHVLCGHPPIEPDSEEARQLFFPDISPTMLTLLRGRSAYTDEEEREAEHVAGVLLKTLLAWSRPEFEEQKPPSDAAARVWLSMGGIPSRRTE
ncbi:hypothetical protein NLX83_15590 [Allokutzneria sp. A3M-2-11 16]|uniref:hypothetical protein n=1 Tax=Allokutzneria sp. A3M-2-11 16 TaxID=2962043 RepID=UPI0020B8540F|nr:hypothetical protein [Allokutzneria sp. A3M-2-11 16]MCP3800690.1 hypothetical protein [Allokutzneria sp. A3M-2-11 16]